METEPQGSLEPPDRKPPTAIGARTPDPDDHPLKEIVVPVGTSVRDLALMMRVPRFKFLWVAFNELGHIVRASQCLPFTETKALAAHFGYSARRPAGTEED